MINNVTLMGRLTAAPELKKTQSGTSVISFCVAVDRNYQKQGTERETDFINCVAWRNTAEFIAKWFNKGDMIAVTGEIQTRKYTDKNGNNRVAVEVVIGQASFCGGKNNSTEAPATDSGSNTAGFAEVDYDGDDLPF